MKIQVAVIGGGVRARQLFGDLLKVSDRQVEPVAVYERDRELAADLLRYWGTPDARICHSPEEAIGTPGVEWVMVFSPNAFHKEHILAGFAAGKHVFSEKPLATTVADCREIYDASRRTDRHFATGFVLRYAPIYRKVKEILDSGEIGRILSIDANENVTPAHGGYAMTNWRRHTAMAGPYILEKCCHDLDLLNYFCDSLPSRIASFGGNDYFNPSNAHLLKKYGEPMYKSWPDPHRIDTPFTDDADLMDNQVSILEYRNRIRVQFQCTMSNIIPERRMYFSCTEGTMIVELYTGTIRYQNIGAPGTTVLDFHGENHGGGDPILMQALFDTMVGGSAPLCSGDEGLNSAVVALSCDEAARTGRIIDLEPIWKSLGR